MPVLEKVNNFDESKANNTHVEELKSEVEYRTKLQKIGNKLYAATNLDEILIELKDEITSLFNAERITVYFVDGIKRELVSRFKSGDEVAEIRIPVYTSSIAGYSAYKQKLINIKNVYDEKELSSIDPDLKFDSSWDKKQVLPQDRFLYFQSSFRSICWVQFN